VNIHQEHKLLRQFLQRIGVTYQYTSDVIPDDGQPDPYVKPELDQLIARTVKPRQHAVREPIRPSATPGPSALDFAMAGQTFEVRAVPGPAFRPEEPKPQAAAVTRTSALDFLGDAPFVQSSKLQPVVLKQPGPSAIDLDDPVVGLRSQPAPSAIDFAGIESPVIAFAASLEERGHKLLTKEGKFFVSNSSELTETDRQSIKALRSELVRLAVAWVEPSMVTFLNNPMSEPEIANWIPDEPPSLDGIDHIIINFATTGFHWHSGDRPVGVTVSTMDGKLTRFLPFAFKGGGNLDEGVVKRWFEREVRNKHIKNSKIKFDIHHAREWGIDLEAQGCTFSDIQHTAALLDDHRKRFGIDYLAKDYLSDNIIARVDESRHADYHAAEVAAREKYTAQLVGRLHEVMYPQIIAEELEAVHHLENGVIPCVVEMEKQGSPIDEDLLRQYGKECTDQHDALMWDISQECGFAFEHTAKGWQRLIESLHLPVPEAFSEDLLSEIDHPLIRKGQRASQYASLNSKIFQAYPKHITDGILRYGINQLVSDEGGTVSGRFSIGLVQQVPNIDNHTAAFGDKLFPRKLFKAGSGQYLEGDAAQIEFRLLVHYSQNAKLLQAYRDNPKMSFHKKMQEMLSTYKPDMLYTHPKSYNFAAQYGARSIKLAVMMEFITKREGEEIRRAKRWNDPRLNLIHEIEKAYGQAHPEASELLDRASHLAKFECDDYCVKDDEFHRKFPHRGYVKTYMGRRSRFPTNYKTYIGLNRVLQGTGASIMKKKIIELHALRKETGFVMRITNHDAVLGDATTPETLGKVSEVLNRQSFPLRVPILWECGTGATWADCK
jgi:DNA polymerase I-like protein with 3'-5' exonuclease and polymerase domains